MDNQIEQYENCIKRVNALLNAIREDAKKVLAAQRTLDIMGTANPYAYSQKEMVKNYQNVLSARMMSYRDAVIEEEKLYAALPSDCPDVLRVLHLQVYSSPNVGLMDFVEAAIRKTIF